MKILIVADIFGQTDALDTLAASLDVNAEIISPYGNKRMAFVDEAQAYEYFSQQITLAGYTQTLLAQLNMLTCPTYLIGFSVGASAIWALSEQPQLQHIIGAQCFNGGQIRHYPHIQPRFPVHLTFPASETHFSVTELMHNLAGTDKVSLSQVPYLHGYMNLHSVNFHPFGMQQTLYALKQAIKSDTTEPGETP